MRIFRLIALLLLAGCSAAPLQISDQLTLGTPEALIIETTPPENLSLSWAPQPIEDFIITQNADGFTGRNDYQVFAVGRLVSKRVESYLGTVSQLVADSDNQVQVRIEEAHLNYKFAWNRLEYAKFLLNAQLTVAGRSKSKVYYRQLIDQPQMKTEEMLEAVLNGVAIEMGQDILAALAR